MNAVVEQSRKPSLMEQITERGITPPQWHTLSRSLYPGAKPESILLVIDYCRARKLDPLKKPCHIVPMDVKDAATGEWSKRDVVMPGVYELRTTAHRTGEYCGHSVPEYGEEIEFAGVKAPEYCAMTFYRQPSLSGPRSEFPVRVYFREVCGTKDRGAKANDRWSRAPIQMLTKCCEAAGLREAFPDELGGQMAEEEVNEPTLIIAAETVGDTAASLNSELGLEENDSAQQTDGDKP